MAAKMTILEMVDNILNALDSDPVDDITDTVESEQVVEIIKEVYHRFQTERDWPHLQLRGSLEADDSGSSLLTKLKIPSNCTRVMWLKYRKNKLTYLTPEEFQDVLDKREEEADVVDSNGYALTKDPEYYTMFEDGYVYFDSYDADVDTEGLDTNETNMLYTYSPDFTASASFTPDIPHTFFSVFLAECKAACFLDIKQQVNAREEGIAKRGRARIQAYFHRLAAAEAKTNTQVNYGRK